MTTNRLQTQAVPDDQMTIEATVNKSHALYGDDHKEVVIYLKAPARNGWTRSGERSPEGQSFCISSINSSVQSYTNITLHRDAAARLVAVLQRALGELEGGD
jgi:hypothetical protein